MPAPKGPKATQHLEKIRWAARRAKPANLGVIEVAVTACFEGACMQGGHSAEAGRPPSHPEHCASVLLARAYAAESNWDGCVAALRHGEPKKHKAKSE